MLLKITLMMRNKKMSFWESDLGDVTGKSEDAFAKQFTQIPDGTKALAKIESFTNQVHKESGFKYLNIEWVLQDGDFKGQKVQQKLKVYGGDTYDKDPAKTRHRALNMLKLLYELFKIKPKHSNPPTDQDLALFSGKIAGLKIRETAPNDKGKQYNWVAEVHPSQGFKSETGIGVAVIAHSAVSNYSSHKAPMDSPFNSSAVDLSDVPF
jgi:hypothetical protein